MKTARFWILCPLLLLACHRGPSQAKIRQDFDSICQTQKTFLQTKQLLKHVRDSDLRAERNRTMGQGRLTEPGMEAVGLVVASGKDSPRKAVEQAARAAGLEKWSCPEF